MNKIVFNYKGKVVLVTGGASGIGEAAALNFAACGASVVVSDINEDHGMKVSYQIKESGGESTFIKCNVSDETNVKSLVAQTIKKYGQINYAFNDAGIEGLLATTSDATNENWEKIINTNLKGTWLCMKYEIPEMLKLKNSAIVNVSSLAGLVGFSGLSAYVASKHGIIGLTKTAAIEYAEKGLRVNAVCPGPIMTPMLQRLMNSSPGMVEAVTTTVPMKRVGTADEIAKTVVFLCSEHASYITGQCIAIDGGSVAQ